MKQPVLHIVITDFNGYGQTGRCLAALRASTVKDLSVLVVDHGTTDETRTRLANDFPGVTRIVGSPDLWWTGATNVGIRAACDDGADRIMLINNDCYVTPSAIGILIDLAERHPGAIIAPMQRDCQSLKPTVIIPRASLLLGFPIFSIPPCLTNAPDRRALLPVKLIAGGRGVIIPRSVFGDIGFFDDVNLPHYWADHDFYFRAVKRGIPLFVAATAVVDVDSSRTTSAGNPGAMDIRSYLASLTDVRSHRNLRHIAALFRKHYPIPRLYLVGVTLYAIRYLLVYSFRRSLFLLKRIRLSS